MWLTPLCVLALLGLSAPRAPAQHVHGVIQLGVVAEGGAVAVSLNAPLADVVGFEHAPESDEQLERIRQAAAVLGNASAMFGLAAAAKCEISATSVDGPAYVTQHLAADDAGPAESHGHDNDSHHDRPVHDNHAAQDGHDHQESEQHAEVSASYEWTCGNATALEAIRLHFPESFAGVEAIEIQIVGPAGARVLTVDGRASSIPLPPP